MQHISSTQNKIYKLIKSLRQKKARTAENMYCVEGVKGCFDALNKGADIKITAVKESLYKSMDFSAFSDISFYTVNDNIFDSLCDTKNPEGIICALAVKDKNISNLNGGLYIYLDSVADPGNCGTIIRTCDACGASGVLLSAGCVDLYNPKTIRSSMGSFFSTDVYTNVSLNDIAALKEKGYSLICAALSDTASDYKTASYPKKTILVIGNESNGISNSCLSLADETVIIPIIGGAESLNASVAAGILMYEWQRNNS